MRTHTHLKWSATTLLLLTAAATVGATVRYVDINCTNATPPYTNWATAAIVIQDAIDLAAAGDEIVVTNGTYATGGRAVYGTMTNRVAVDKPLTVRSVNGPEVTIIQGVKAAGAGSGTGPTAIRCVYLTNAASLSGFTLTNGATHAVGDLSRELCGGGVWCASATAVVSNCVLRGNSASRGGAACFGTLNNCTLATNSASSYGGGAYSNTLSNCTLTNNSAQYGGGSCLGTLDGCTLAKNSASFNGGGAYSNTLNNCTLAGNSAVTDGGGVYGGRLTNCILAANAATYGGGASWSALNNCTLSTNSASGWGGGAVSSTLTGCVLTGNRALSLGGGGASDSKLNNCLLSTNTGPAADSCKLTNCTVTGNSGVGASVSTLRNCALTANLGDGAGNCTLYNCTLTGNSGVGASRSTLANCIVYYNGGPQGSNYLSGGFNYCCTTPLPPGGTGNLDSEPQLASWFRLSANSPCIGKGSFASAKGVDIDGEPWVNPPSIGCDEYYSGSQTGALSVAVTTSYTGVGVGFSVDFQALISGRASASRWEFGDGTVVSNRPCASHAWVAPGDYDVALVALNETYPEGVRAHVTVRVMAQPTHYVAAGNANPASPYISWATAATKIQDALDAATPGATVLVTNGIYSTGGSSTSRANIVKALLVQSVNGPQMTTINGGGKIRCAYLADGAVLSGFTLTNGYLGSFGDYGAGAYCASTNAVITNCTLAGSHSQGGGGGIFGGTLFNCILTNNSATVGDGAYYSLLNHCTLTGNSYVGAWQSTLNNCAVTANLGVGAEDCTLYNCTLTGNADLGASDSTLNDCILYYNGPHGTNNYVGGSLNYCCTTPLPSDGIGNTNAEPQLADWCHLSASSPCIGKGSSSFTGGVDIDGEPWANPPSIGCDEYYSGSQTGALSIALTASYIGVGVGFSVDFQARISGHPSASRWEFGDGTVVSNRPYVSHAWAAPADYDVVLVAYNETYPEGVRAHVTVHVMAQPTYYVAVDNANPMPPYMSWATAATNIQDALDAATPGATVLVTNGIYATGSGTGIALGLTARAAVTKPLTLRSINGPQATAITGGGVIRCAYLADGAVLSGFTLTNAYSDWKGAGAYCASASGVITNCTVTGNRADGSGAGVCNGILFNCILTNNYGNDFGGGAYYSVLKNCVLVSNSCVVGGGACNCTLDNCILKGNSSSSQGGGAFNCTMDNCAVRDNTSGWLGGGTAGSTLHNCTITGNSAVTCGGVSIDGNSGNPPILYNCIVLSNTAQQGDNYDNSAILNYCCTSPLPTAGFGNITNAPLCVDYIGGNLRLQSNSPCINAGNNAYVTATTDLDASPRIVGGTVDIGAYEYQGIGSMISYAWLQEYGLPTDGSADYEDSDSDGLNNRQEWHCLTNPTNALSVLHLLPPSFDGTNVMLSWEGVAGVSYFLEWSTNLAPNPSFSSLATNLLSSQSSILSYTDTNTAAAISRIYRLGVGN
jgi:hypothetical protein